MLTFPSSTTVGLTCRRIAALSPPSTLGASPRNYEAQDMVMGPEAHCGSYNRSRSPSSKIQIIGYNKSHSGSQRQVPAPCRLSDLASQLVWLLYKVVRDSRGQRGPKRVINIMKLGLEWPYQYTTAASFRRVNLE
jgi:hypothetical protein